MVLGYLDQMNTFKSVQEYSGVIHICSRTGDVIEPMVLPHWFLKTQKLTNEFTNAINSKDFIISPNNYSTDLLHTLSNCQ
jgi:valyl-tRNA synthetase